MIVRIIPSTMPSPHSTSGAPKRVVLLGFMGAGKSTVGPLLAARFGWPFYDVDSVIEVRAGMSVPEIFRIHGEAAFRVMEADTISELLTLDPCVIALGGGAIEHPSTRLLFSSASDTYTVFLDARLETMIDRCKVSPNVRPLLQDLSSLPERYLRRLPLYQEAAITVSTEGRSPDAVAEAVFAKLTQLEPIAGSMEREQKRSL